MRYAVVRDYRGDPWVLYGVNVELMRWVYDTIDGKGAGTALRIGGRYQGDKGRKDLINDMLLILGGGLGHDFQKAEEFMDGHWHAHPQLGPYPCLGLLAKCQAAGVFHSGYRDHVVHQLKTYLLGLCVFHSCQSIKDAVLAEVEKNLPAGRTPPQEFHLRWLAAALAHDAGYILENAAADPSRGDPGKKALYEQVLQEFGAVIKYPLARSHEELENEAYKSLHTNLADEIDAKEQSITSEQSLFCLPMYSSGKNAMERGKDKAWAILKEGTRPCGLGLTDKKTIRDYYDFTWKYRTNYGERFPDHGVVSALLLLRAWHARADFLEFLEQRKQKDIGPLNQPVFDWVRDADRSDWKHTQTIEAAAAAIALHNIDPNRYTKGSLSSEWRSLFRTRLDIALTATKDRQPLALAFLLRLCDTLQDWDRPKFRPLTSGERLLESRDFSLKADDKGIHVFYRENPKGLFDKLVADLKIALVEKQVEALLRQDTTETGVFVRFSLPEGQEKAPKAKAKAKAKAEADADELPDPAELGEELREKFSSLCGGKPVTIGVCGKPPRGRCPVRTQTVHALAESARITSEVDSVATILRYLSEATHAARLLHTLGRNVGASEVQEWLLNLHNAAYYLAESFKRTPGKREDDKDQLSAEERCQLFFGHRADPQDAAAVQTAIWAVLDLFGKKPDGVPSKRSMFTTSFAADPLWSLLSTLASKGQDLVTALRKAVSQRTGVVAATIAGGHLQGNGQVAQDTDPDRLGRYVNDLIGAFPHNDDKAPRIWRGKQQGAKV